MLIRKLSRTDITRGELVLMDTIHCNVKPLTKGDLCMTDEHALIMCRCLPDRWKEEEALQITDQDIDWGSLTRCLAGFGRNSLGLPDPECTYS